MAQVWLTGPGAGAMLERLTPTDTGAIAEGRVRYSLFLNDAGGVLDDLMIARHNDILQLVVNAGRADHDIGLLRASLDSSVTMDVRSDLALLALQGPAAPQVLARRGGDIDGFTFMQIRTMTLAGTECVVTRSGYTGEDGFEISVPATRATDLASALAADADVTLAGLGARDTLRLEAGLPLWGHELDETITPVAAGLRFALSKRRREAADFPGAATIMAEWNNGTARILTGLLPQGGRPVRDGAELALDGRTVGTVTSGGFAPTLDAPAALGFVDAGLATPGTNLVAVVRGREIPVVTAALPLVPHRYVRN
jgi:aminomethyltransferase